MVFRIIIGVILFAFALAMWGMFALSFKSYITNASLAYWNILTRDFYADQPPIAMFFSSIISWIISGAFVYILFSTNHFFASIILLLLIVWDVIAYLRTKTVNNKYKELCKKKIDTALSLSLLRYESISLVRVIIALNIMGYAVIVM